MLNAHAVKADAVFTHEITSNEIKACRGNGDTLWMLTATGINFTTRALAATSGQITWQGYKSSRIENESFEVMAYGAGTCLVPLRLPENESTNDILVFSENTAPSVIRLPFLVSQFSDTAALPKFAVADIRWSEGYFWMACLDGGLVRMDASDTQIFYPGRNTPYNFSTFTKDSFPHIPSAADSQVITLDADASSHSVWVARPGQLWRLATDSLTWTLIDTISATEDSLFYGITARDSQTVFVSIITADSSGGTANIEQSGVSLNIYRRSDGTSWKKENIYHQKASERIAILDSGHLYVIHNDVLTHWKCRDTAPAVNLGFLEGHSYDALQSGIDVISPVISDIFYTDKSDTGLFWIATSEGLFLSFSSPFRADSLANLILIRKDIAVTRGLKNGNVYAFPSILNDSYRNQFAVFAYNLEKDDYVTIDIFDWNMDYVVRVVNDKFRYAGATRPDGAGISTVRSEDFWDGTYNNRGGKTVAPGVYYFRIRARSRGQAVGKLIVAKPN
jgi:hypothetical protein